ncbi:ABC transporter substrate-binding protein [Oscillospiraceae bacterium MB08-C2-2]|nr:ABC transporter substrate-binding protein [Oscillospiraceae bacterium MB08-C2-2]
MKKLRKLTALAACVAMLASLAACSGGGSSSVPAASAPEAPAASQAAESTEAGDGKTYVVGISQLVQHEALDAATAGFRAALTEKLNNKVTFDEQNAQGDPATCSAIASGFVSSNVDLIMANATPALQAAAAATSDIPILGTSITEYGVALDIADFNGTVGGNISGTSDLAPLDQQATMIKEFFPDAKKVGLIYCSAEANSLYQVNTVKAALEGMGYACELYPFSDSNDLASITTNATKSCDVIYVPTDNTVASNTGIIDNICQPAKIPVIAGEKGIAAGCGVATLSIDYYDLGYSTGLMAAKILTGESDISTMPVEYAPNFTKMYNPAICEALGITPPAGYEPIEA